jgi:hypothetical protein
MHVWHGVTMSAGNFAEVYGFSNIRMVISIIMDTCLSRNITIVNNIIVLTAAILVIICRMIRLLSSSHISVRRLIVHFEHLPNPLATHWAVPSEQPQRIPHSENPPTAYQDRVGGPRARLQKKTWTEKKENSMQGSYRSPSAQTQKRSPPRAGAAGLISQSQNSLASLGGTPSPCMTHHDPFIGLAPLRGTASPCRTRHPLILSVPTEEPNT